MIKKIILISIFCMLLLSCGKKDDPEYKAKKNNVLIFRI
tara:strand:+ start:615 stop:731 length:117 start_codon:yes stop_codon:yes gene_type:complete